MDGKCYIFAVYIDSLVVFYGETGYFLEDGGGSLDGNGEYFNFYSVLFFYLVIFCYLSGVEW